MVAGLALLAGCTTVRGLVDTENALERAGFSAVDVSFSSDNGFDQVEVAVRPARDDAAGADAALRTAAETVWSTFPLRFDLLRVELVGPFEGRSVTYTSSEMAEIFGSRDPKLDEKALGDDVVRAGLGVVIVLLVGGVLFLGGVVLAIVFGVRASRRRASADPPPWPPVPKPDA